MFIPYLNWIEDKDYFCYSHQGLGTRSKASHLVKKVVDFDSFFHKLDKDILKHTKVGNGVGIYLFVNKSNLEKGTITVSNRKEGFASGQNEDQADPPAVDPSLIGLINKTRADHAVILTLLHDGQFADHVQGSKTDRIHAQGQGQIRTEIVTTLMNKWSEYCASPFWLQFAEKNYLEPSPIP